MEEKPKHQLEEIDGGEALFEVMASMRQAIQKPAILSTAGMARLLLILTDNVTGPLVGAGYLLMKYHAEEESWQLALSEEGAEFFLRKVVQ